MEVNGNHFEIQKNTCRLNKDNVKLSLIYFLALLRYNMFIVMYPLGVIGELLTIHAALPYVRRSGMFSLRLPNKYNVSFDYYYFLIIVMLSYIPCKNSMKHLLSFTDHETS